jgi:hypothetical protein
MVDVVVGYEDPAEPAKVQPSADVLADCPVSTVNECHLVIDDEGMGHRTPSRLRRRPPGRAEHYDFIHARSSSGNV